jgi:hypothetical protein
MNLCYSCFKEIEKAEFFSRKEDVVSFIEKSFMSKEAKEAYRDQFKDRLKAMQ